MGKKLLIGLIIFLGIVISPSAAMAATLAISPTSGSLNKGCEYSVNIELDTQGSPTDGTDVILIYEPAKLTVTSAGITNGKIYEQYVGNSVDPVGGKISISGIASVSDAFTGKGTFATVKFTVAAAATGTTTLKLDFDPNNKTKTVDSNVVERGAEIADVLSQVTDGVFTIGTGSCGAIGNAPPQGQVGTSPLPGITTLPVNPPVASASTLPIGRLPDSGILDNTLLVASVGMILVILGVVGLAAL